MNCMVTLKQVEAFYWAATLANFSLASGRLHISQSSLSKRIAELEAQLGRALFDRSGHRCQLTQPGQTLLPLARRLLRSADELVEAMADTGHVRGVCRFGVGELAALSWLPRFVVRAREVYPGLVLEPQVDLGRALEERVESGELDFAVVAGTSTRVALSSQVIARVRFLWAGSPALVGERRVVTAELLGQLAVITMPTDAGSAREFDNWLIANGLEVGPPAALQQPRRHRRARQRRRRRSASCPKAGSNRSCSAATSCCWKAARRCRCRRTRSRPAATTSGRWCSGSSSW